MKKSILTTIFIFIIAATSMTITAAPARFRITLDDRGGRNGGESIIVDYGKPLPQVPVPQKDNATFGGYYTLTEGRGTQIYAANGTSSQNMTFSYNLILYARWIPACQNGHSYKNTVEPATFKSNGRVIGTCTHCKHISISSTPRIRSVTLSKNSFVYTGRSITPEVIATDNSGRRIGSGDYSVSYSNYTNIGTAIVSVNFRNRYMGSTALTYTIVPKGTKIKSVKGGKRSFIVRWKKQRTATHGYELQYCRKKSFKGAKKLILGDSRNYTGFKITKLKKKTRYYVRVRTYREVGGRMYCSAWSKTRKVRTK